MGIVTSSAIPPPSPKLMEAICNTLRHRGPDDIGYDVLANVGLGMRRLSIIDILGGRQPYFNEDRTIRAVFNGEIYNFHQLRRDLELRGHQFRSNADGEVIVHLWEEYGADFPTHLNGMFAIALHDSNLGRVILVRDRLGIKPLYYFLKNGHLAFGSEIKAILETGLMCRGLDLDALGQFFAWEYVPAPHTLFKDIKKLEPAAIFEVDTNTLAARMSTYWDLPDINPVASVGHTGISQLVERLDAKVRESVRRQLVSDVPLGAFLSGGVDSSLVVAAMDNAAAFTIGFDEPSYNEMQWASLVAKHLGLRHESEIIKHGVVDLFDCLMHFMDDPIADFSIFPTYLVSRLARRSVTVALSGDGGDELFAGYDTYVANSMAGIWDYLPSSLLGHVLNLLLCKIRPTAAKKGLVNKLKRFGTGLQIDKDLGHARWRLFVPDQMRSFLFAPEARAGMETPAGEHIRALSRQAGHRTVLDRSLYIDLKSYLSDNCLTKMDRMSMACSLEVRVPFLDHELVETAFSVPSELKLAGRETKSVLKKVAARHVPAKCVYRPKEGFSIPLKHWLKTEFRPLMEDQLSPMRLRQEGVFNVAAVNKLKADHLRGVANNSHILWTLIVFQDWRRRWSV